MKKIFVIQIFFLVVNMFSQNSQKDAGDFYVDSSGVMRWTSTNEEAALFGVNYTTPFAYSYRAHKKLGLSLKKAIDLDVAQMKRLRLDAFRVHVWEKEISDSAGNLIKNEHLDLFDYLLAKLAENGIKTVLTPIAWWGIGWPEPDIPTNGYSSKYSKLELVTNAVARKAQRNYLQQFIEHVNPYRKLSYKDDRSVIAVEITNEPHHPDSVRAVTDYINEMAGVLRSAGFKKPIFYNISETWSTAQANAVTKSKIDGITFQWYPTGLVHGKMLHGNYLMNVNHYKIPSDGVADFSSKTKMVYEFDAADIGSSYMYPAMARSFREAGMQFATMFAYDPTQIAWSNTEYPTHYMNLLYTPSKAISLLIAGKAFKQLPRLQSYGDYPANNVFENFRVSSEEDVSEMNSDNEFYYSNSTHAKPKNITALHHIAGCGNSSIVQYDGTGAYFLDNVEEGIWRLEIYPDVLWLRDPFEQTSMSRQAARLFWNERKIKLFLPDLGDEYSFVSLSGAKQLRNSSLKPGIYLVCSKSAQKNAIKKYSSKKEKYLEGLYAPPSSSSGIYVVNKTDSYASELAPSVFKFCIASEQKISSASLYIKRLGWRGFAKHELKHSSGFEYVLADTPKVLKSGKLEYCIEVKAEGNTFTFPGEIKNSPSRWDFSEVNLWTVNILDTNSSFVLFDAERDRKDIVAPHFSHEVKYSLDYKEGEISNEQALACDVTFASDANIPFGLQFSTNEVMHPLRRLLENYRTIVVKGRSHSDSSCTFNIVFRTMEGKNYFSSITLTQQWNEISIPISSFQNGQSLMLPNSYPLFLPKVWESSSDEILKCSQIESVQIVVDPSKVTVKNGKKELNVEIVSLTLRK